MSDLGSESAERPRLRLRRTRLDTFLEISGAMLFALFAFVVISTWSRLPERVPIHFGFSGAPDAWAPRASALLLPLIAALLYGMLTLLARVPHALNYPWPITQDNAATQYRLAAGMLRTLRSALVLLFFAIYVFVWMTAAGRAEGLPAWFLPATIAAVFGVVGVYLRAAWRAR